MNKDQMQRGGRILAARMAELGLSAPELARKAGLDPTTIRAAMRGERWPHSNTRRRLNNALDWPEGEIIRRTLDGATDLADVPTRALLRELCKRNDVGDV